MLTRRKAISFSWTWTRARHWTWRRRFRRSREIGPFSGEEALEGLGSKIGFRLVLIGPELYRHGIVRIVKLCFHRGNLLLLDEKKIAVQFVRQTVLLVISNAPEIIEHPRQRIRAWPNNVANQVITPRMGMGQLQDRIGEFVNVVITLDVNVRFSVGGAAKIIQPNAISERNADHDARQKLCNFRRSQREQKQTSSENQYVRPGVFELARFCIVKCVGEKAEKYECDPPIGCGRKSQRRDRSHGAKRK